MAAATLLNHYYRDNFPEKCAKNAIFPSISMFHGAKKSTQGFIMELDQ